MLCNQPIIYRVSLLNILLFSMLRGIGFHTHLDLS